MIRISDWYARLSDYTFTTVFVNLSAEERQILLNADIRAPGAKPLIERIRQAIRAIPWSAFVATDTCAPNDSPLYSYASGVFTVKGAWQLLTSSDKVRRAWSEGKVDRLVLRPNRRLNRRREFRMFFKGRELKAMSQYHLDRHFASIEERRDEIWKRAQEFAAKIGPLLPMDDVVVDVYLTANHQYMIIDLNEWGGGTDPKLLKTWERDWNEVAGLRIIPKPMQLKGDVKVSF